MLVLAGVSIATTARRVFGSLVTHERRYFRSSWTTYCRPLTSAPVRFRRVYHSPNLRPRMVVEQDDEVKQLGQDPVLLRARGSATTIYTDMAGTLTSNKRQRVLPLSTAGCTLGWVSNPGVRGARKMQDFLWHARGCSPRSCVPAPWANPASAMLTSSLLKRA